MKLTMLGIITPLLIDSLLIGYYYNRTGFFSAETFFLWSALLILAIGGTWLAWRSMRQSIFPLEKFIVSSSEKADSIEPSGIEPLSLDEIGVLSSRYSDLLLRFNESKAALQEKDILLSESERIGHVGSWKFDLMSGQIVWSEETYRIFRVSPKEFVPDYESFMEMIKYDDRPIVKKWIDDFAASKDPGPVVFRVRWADGTIRILNSHGKMFHTSEGNPAYMIGMVRDITEEKQKEEIIWKQANFDSLTKLPNRNMGLDKLVLEIKRAQRKGLPLALLFIDSDGFKEVNDSLGHAKGDLLLIEATKRMVRHVRETDTIARLGGDEFTILLPEFGGRSTVERIAQEILRDLAQPFDFGEGNLGRVEASIGVALYPDDARNAENLLQCADQAMYISKREGGGRFSYFTERLQKEAEEKRFLLADLRLALARNQLEVYYQPIMAFGGDQVTKAEALLRWKHPGRGMISPDIFIPIAEESGLIHEIGEWVFQDVISRIVQWRNSIGCLIQVSVNKFPLQFTKKFKNTWLCKLQELGLPGNVINVEITEGLLIKDSETAKNRLIEFRNSGVEVSIDDFGTRFSSLSYLKQYDIDYIKIDRSFINDLEFNPNDRALTEAIIAMAHKLDIATIAEGVETQEQYKLLKSFGCDYYQGFLFSPAVPAADFEHFIAHESEIFNMSSQR